MFADIKVIANAACDRAKRVQCAHHELRKEIFQLRTEVKNGNDKIFTLGNTIKYYEDETRRLRAEVESQKAAMSKMDEDMGNQAEYFGFCMQDMKTALGVLEKHGGP